MKDYVEYGVAGGKFDDDSTQELGMNDISLPYIMYLVRVE
jgi:hypothetical protein